MFEEIRNNIMLELYNYPSIKYSGDVFTIIVLQKYIKIIKYIIGVKDRLF